jgi:SAM-dependent methyltransferase
MAKRRERLPSYVPQWIQRRVEVNVYELYEFVEEIGASLTPEDRVLDAGAGQGRFRPELKHTRYVSVDLAVGDAKWDYDNLDAICDLVHLPFGRVSFDAATCFQVLEHVPDPLSVLEEISRVLKPGGHLFLSAPQSWHQHQTPHDYYRYTSFGLQYLIEQSGMVLESAQPMGGYFWFLSFQLQNINYWLFPRGMPGRIWTWPLRALFGFLFQLVIPLFLFYLDPLDRIKDETFGHICVATKPKHE